MTSHADTERDTVTYVYGVVPADVETDPEARGVGDPPSSVDVVRHRDIAALVSEVSAKKPLGKPEDLSAHAHLVDAAVVEGPVLPMRFGAVVTDRQAVEEELLAGKYDEFLGALRQMEGKAQYVVKGRYVEEAILREILADNPRLVELRDQVRGEPEAATRDERIALGEMVNQALSAKRDADTATLRQELEPMCTELSVREPTHERDAVYLACLADADRQGEIEQAVQAFAREHNGRIDMHLLGPMAPYDFVLTREPQG